MVTDCPPELLGKCMKQIVALIAQCENTKHIPTKAHIMAEIIRLCLSDEYQPVLMTQWELMLALEDKLEHFQDKIQYYGLVCEDYAQLIQQGRQFCAMYGVTREIQG